MTPNSELIDLIEIKLETHQTIHIMAAQLRIWPEILSIYEGELTAALDLYARLRQNPSGFVYQSELLINASYLLSNFASFELPSWKEILTRLIGHESDANKDLLEEIFTEVGQFEFLDAMEDPHQLAGALLIAIYRTYTLVSFPFLRQGQAQIASTVEEMLAVFALEGWSTNLFRATSIWILDYEREGFARGLAQKIERYVSIQ